MGRTKTTSTRHAGSTVDPESVPYKRQKAPSFYVILFLLVVPLWSITPLSWAYLIYSIATGNGYPSSAWGKIKIGMALTEVLFSIYYRSLHRKVRLAEPYSSAKTMENVGVFGRWLKTGLSQQGYTVPASYDDIPNSPIEDLVDLTHDDPRAIDFRNFLRNWFGKVPWSSICRDNMAEWIHWFAFNQPIPSPDKLTADHKWVIEDGIHRIEQRSGTQLPKGYNTKASPILLTLDHVNIASRPFLWYLFSHVAQYVMQRHYVNVHGVKFAKYRGLEYMVRIPKHWDRNSDLRPIVFIHGLGLGIAQYSPLLIRLMREFPNQPVLVLIQPHISQQIFHPRYMTPMGRHETANCLAGLLEYLGWAEKRQIDDFCFVGNDINSVGPRPRKGVTILSHSNGSYVHAWMLKSYPTMITASCFVDPVAFCLWEGDVCYNFVYKPSATGFQLLMRYFVANEIGVANLLQRHFDWSSNALFFEEIPNARDERRTKFVFGGKDSIMNSARVDRYLTAHGVKDGLWLDPNGRHGQALAMGTPGYAEVERWLKNLY